MLSTAHNVHKLGVKRVKEIDNYPKQPFYSIKRGYCGSIGWGVTDDKSKILNQTIYHTHNNNTMSPLNINDKTNWEIDSNSIKFFNSTISPTKKINDIKRSVVTMLLKSDKIHLIFMLNWIFIKKIAE